LLRLVFLHRHVQLSFKVIFSHSCWTNSSQARHLWKAVTAKKIRIVEHRESEIRRFVKNISSDDLFKPVTWTRMSAFVRVIPDGDILPSRSKYSLESNDWQVAINHLYANSDKPEDALWFSLPDVVASKLLTGRTPKIVDAFRVVPVGTLKDLVPIRLRGVIDVDPSKQDFFKVAIEQRLSAFFFHASTRRKCQAHHQIYQWCPIRARKPCFWRKTNRPYVISYAPF
jgi:hypothetical protein